MDPVIFCIGNLCVRWYSMAYIVGIIGGWYLIKNYNNKIELFDAKKIEDDAFFYVIFGIILGGRLGYVMFYNFSYYIRHLLDIFKVWEGGMSFHGGMLGVICGCYLLAKKHKINFLSFIDLISAVAPIGLFFGRIANFINQELYGRATNSSFGIVFAGTDGIPRHPSQLYEAFFEGFVLFFIMLYFVKRKNNIVKNEKKGFLTGFAISYYGMVRFFIEFFREPDAQIGYIFNYFTMGQILCLPMVAIGLYLMFKKK
jgi:phosphatidylglycerol:prolipoprotein diacylglycerol transferase